MSTETNIELKPKHIAVIMDGNNRYGKINNLAKGQGHIAGKDALDPIVEYCVSTGIEVLTVFAFSSENWQRPPSEVALLMHLLSLTINEQLPRMQKYRIRSGIPVSVQSSGNPFNRSHSIGVSTRRQSVIGSCTT